VAALVWKEENVPSKRSHPPSPKDRNDDIFTMLEKIKASHSTGSVSPVGESVCDLELMMRWCNSTHEIFARNEATAWIWRQLVPQEALSHQFLLWGILSISALDLSRSKNDEHRSIYLNAATSYQTRALTVFRQVLQEVNASNAKAVFAFASIVAVYGFGSCDGIDMTDPIQDLYQVIMLIRGVHQVVICVASTLLDSEFAPLLQMDDDYEEIPPDAAAALTHLHALNDSIHNGTETHEAHRKAIQSLGSMISSLRSRLSPMTVCGKWAIKLLPLFLDCLQERQPLALIILTHYCVLFNYLRRCWCLAPWARAVSQAVWDILDEEGRNSLRWPMGQIFSQESSEGD
jgi:Fungal specific transcription factor domain